ncbi:MAG: hypothetical protein ACTSVV_04595 [Promethearchaeota archaeon]
MVDFLIILDNISEYSKKDIDLGNTPPDVYKLCSIIRETFCLSYAIRKQNNLYIFNLNQYYLIKFEGKSLRFLGSDERSQAILLRKALDKLKTIESKNYEKWLRSTPGIFVNKLYRFNSFIYWLQNLNNNNFAFIFEKINPFDIVFLAHMFDYPKIINFSKLNSYINNLNQLLFVISNKKDLLIRLLRKIAENFPTILERIYLVKLRRVISPEDIILFINFSIDKQYPDKIKV